jgi:membrane-associated protease RseP (regulator of RpoE activity)
MSNVLPPPPSPSDAPAPDSRSFSRFQNEVMAGGASDAPGEPEPTAGGSRALVGLLMIGALLALLYSWSPWAFVFVMLLVVCVFLHELGHFMTARWTGMKATQFFLFMGPKLWSFRRGETEYGVRLYPVGAFVRIIGMNSMDEVSPEDEPRAYRNKSYPRRMLVICAGSIMHMLIAVSLLFGVYAVKGQLGPTGEVRIESVVVGDPAGEAGIKPGDIVQSVDGVVVTSADQFVSAIQSQQPKDVVAITLLRDGVEQTIEVGLGSNPNQGPSFGKAYLGTRSGDVNDWQSMSVFEAARSSVTDLGSNAWATVGGIVKVFNPVNIVRHLTGATEDLATRPTTVVGISQFSGLVGGETGLAGILLLLAGVNVSLGLLNMLPMLPLDGGHAAIATYERLRSRKGEEPYHADVAKLIPFAMMTIGLLVTFMLAGLYLDIVKPLGG